MVNCAPFRRPTATARRTTKYHSSKAREVKLLGDALMLTVNTRQAHAVAEDMTSWESGYLPYCKEILQLTGRPRRKLSTTRGMSKSGVNISSLTLAISLCKSMRLRWDTIPSEPHGDARQRDTFCGAHPLSLEIVTANCQKLIDGISRVQ
jgi:hypothetical protein